MLNVLPQDPVFGIIFKSHKAALLRTADLRQKEERAWRSSREELGLSLPPSPSLVLQKTGQKERCASHLGVWPSGTGGRLNGAAFKGRRAG